MLLLAKAAVGIGTTLAVAGAYTFHEGTIRVDVDEYREGGSHVHLWVPAAAVPMAMHLVPKHHLMHAAEHTRQFMPVALALVKELKNYPDADFVEVSDGEQHIQIRTNGGKLQIDATEPGQNLHLLLPLSTLEELTRQLDDATPGA